MASNPDTFASYFAQNLRGKTFLDLGAGYGEIVELARDSGAAASGIEWEDYMLRAHDCRARDLLTLGDFMDTDFTHDFLFYFLMGYTDEAALKAKLSDYEGTLILNTETCSAAQISAFLDGLECNYVGFNDEGRIR